MVNAFCIDDVIEGIDSLPGEDEKLKKCLKISFKIMQNLGYLDKYKVHLIYEAYSNGIEDLRAVAWYLRKKTNEAVLMSVDQIKETYSGYRAKISEINRERSHKRFYRALSEHAKVLLSMRERPEFGSWEALEEAIKNGVASNPQFFGLLSRLKDDSRNLQEQVESIINKVSQSIDIMRKYEKINSVNLVEYK